MPVITYLSLIRPPLLASDHSPARPPALITGCYFPRVSAIQVQSVSCTRFSVFRIKPRSYFHSKEREFKRSRERERIASIGKQQVTDKLTMDDNQGASSAYSSQFARTPDGLPPFHNPDDETTDSDIDPDPFRSDAQPVFPDPQRERERVLREVQNESL